MLMVLAGTAREFEYWRRKFGYGTAEARFVSKPEDLFGIKSYSFVRYGSWYDRSDARAILARHHLNKIMHPDTVEDENDR